MARHSVISVGFLKWAVSAKQEHIGMTLLRIKAEDGRVIHFTRYKKTHLARLVEMNLLGRCPISGVYFQRSWPEILRILGISEMSFVTITHKVLFKYSLRDLAYSAVLQYKFRLQEDGGTLNGKRKGKSSLASHMHPSVHIGGIAHSLMAKEFNMSVHWSQNRRKSCQRRGLLKFTRRRARPQDFKQHDTVPETELDYKAFDITSACNVRVRFKFCVPRWIRKGLRKRVVFNAKEGVYVRVG